MKLHDGREVQVDLLGVLGHFRQMCKNIARAREYQIAHPGVEDPERRGGHFLKEEDFEKELQKLNYVLRGWWEDFKQNHHDIYP